MNTVELTVGKKLSAYTLTELEVMRNECVYAVENNMAYPYTIKRIQSAIEIKQMHNTPWFTPVADSVVGGGDRHLLDHGTVVTAEGGVWYFEASIEELAAVSCFNEAIDSFTHKVL